MTRNQYLKCYREASEAWIHMPQWIRDWTLVRLREMEKEVEDSERPQKGHLVTVSVEANF